MNRIHRVFCFSRAHHASIAIIGGGTAGLNASAQLISDGHTHPQDITIFEPHKMHAYQPGWAMVGGGFYDINLTLKPMESVLHKHINLNHGSVVKIDPDNNILFTSDGDKYTYDQLIIASGINLDFDQIKGAREHLEQLSSLVGCVYHYKYAQKFNLMVKNFNGGKVVFTEPPAPIKGGGAPQNMMYLTYDRLKEKGVKSELHFYKAASEIFHIPKYAEVLQEVIQEKNCNIHLNQNLIEVMDKTLIFKDTNTGETSEVDYDMLHLVPPQVPPKFIAESGLGAANGFVDVHPNTLQHAKYTNIWALGDTANLPTSKTAAAIMAQTPILVRNLINSWKNHQAPAAHYYGYTSCPIFTHANKLLLAEYKYGNQLDETFPVFQSAPSRSMYQMKVKFFPITYWKFMVHGLWGGRDGFRLLKGG